MAGNLTSLRTTFGIIRKVMQLTIQSGIIVLLIIVCGGLACTKDAISPLLPPVNCLILIEEPTYQADIIPLIVSYCYGSTCHSAGPVNYDFTTYDGLADRIRSGRLEERLLLSPGNPLHMPQGGIMDTCDLYTLRVWIQQGFKNN